MHFASSFRKRKDVIKHGNNIMKKKFARRDEIRAKAKARTAVYAVENLHLEGRLGLIHRQHSKRYIKKIESRSKQY